MTPENICLLLNEIDEKKKSAESLANMKAMDYVESGNEIDRDKAKAYLHDAEIWSQARKLVAKYRTA